MKCIILGAGPAGVTFANKLKLLSGGAENFLILERENDAGGLCRSVEVDDAPLDIGGGHFLDVRLPYVNEFLFQFMPVSEWDLYSRKTTIQLNSNVIGQPIEANIWQLPLHTQVEYLKSIAVAGCNIGKQKPEKFVDWVYWKLGKKIAEDYMIPYNQKMFGSNLNQLGTYWLEKLPDVSFEETLLSCLTHKPYGKDPGHTQFYYPKKYGYGELWLRMADSVSSHIEYGKSINSLDYDSMTVGTTDGSKYHADIIVSTIPWISISYIKGMPGEIREGIQRLKYSSIQTEYHSKNLDTDSHWIYYSDLSLPYHRILVRHNFCPESRGYWTETNYERVDNNTKTGDNYKYLNEYAYPLNTIDKPIIMDKLLRWSSEHNVFGLGRWGEHSHFNSDVTVGRALELAKEVYLKWK